jgi:amino acid adenylation domain-containing protein
MEDVEVTGTAADAAPAGIHLPEGIAEHEVLPASFAQERLWLVQQLDPGSRAYNLFRALRLEGALDAAALERALGEVVRRHESLRTTFREEGGVPVQVIAPASAFRLAVEPVAGDDEAEREARVRRRLADEVARPFDLAAGPLFRAGLLRLGEGHHVLMLGMHHVVSDGWSMEVLYRELSALYAAYSAGAEPALDELPVQYADYALWQREQLEGEGLAHDLAWWKARLADAPALLELPADHPRPAARTERGAHERFALPEGLAERLDAVARAEGATPFMTLLAGFQVLLSKYAGVDEVVVGTPVAGRTDAGVEGLIGLFANMLVVRTRLDGDPAFREVLRRVRAAALGAFEHQEVPFDQLVAELQPERSLGHTPLFQVAFALEGAARPAAWPGLRVSPVETELDTAKWDLMLTLSAEGGALRGSFAYSTDLWEAESIRRIARHLERVLEQAAAYPDRPLSRVELADAPERTRILESWSGADVESAGDGCIHRLFARQAARTPDAVALVGADGSLTYAELDARADRLARHLRRAGVGTETRVGICLERGMETIVCILAVLKAGGAYVPLDPSHPAERLAFLLNDAGVAVVLTRAALTGALPPAEGVAVLPIDALPADDSAREFDRVMEDGGPAALAYVMYTSGSTGTPKGAGIEHRAVVRLVRKANYADLGADEVILHAAPVSFDASTLEIWGALLNGGRLVVMPGHTPSPAELGDAIVRHGVTTLWLTAGLFAVMVEERLDDLAGVRQLLAGGDVLPVDAVRRVRARFPGLRLINGYGPTENTTFTCCHAVDGGWRGGPVPIGTPIRGTRVYVLDPAGLPVPAGVPGELYAGGRGVARGYLNRPALTAERFVPDPFSAEPGARLYCTGDRVRWSADGVVEYLGRLDQQVKIRGFRIEPGEVEAVLRLHPAVADCAVVVREDVPGGRRLAAYVVGEVAMDDVRAHLRARLPEHMVPAAFVSLDALPLTANGKVDRRALPAPERAGDAGEYAPPRTPVEEVLAAVWAELLGVDRVGRDDGFFALGGHSLLAMRAVSRIREALGVELPLRALFEAPTVAELAQRLERAEDAAGPSAPLTAQDADAAPLSFAQERLWFLDRLEPGTALYNVPATVRLRGALNAAALERALGEVVRRHAALRTTFAQRDGVPVQVIAPFAGFVLPVEEWSGRTEAEVMARVAEHAAAPFDLAAGPLFRAALLRLGADEHLLVACMHHVCSDGWSLGVLFGELSALYTAFVEGRDAALPELPVQYADYAAWQREQLRDEALAGPLAWWKARLADVPALLELPADHPRPAVRTHGGAAVDIHLSPEMLERLRALGRAEGATLFMVLLTAFQSLLARYAGTADVVVGTPIAGRTRHETEGMIGFFVNTLVLRAELAGDPPFREAVRRARAATLGAFEHQEVPFERLVAELRPERSLAHAPLFQVMFSVDDAAERVPALAGIRAEPVEVAHGITKFDLGLAAAPGPDGLRCRLSYATDLFERATIERMAGHLARLLEQVAADGAVPLSRIELMDPAERRALDAWSGTDAPYPAARGIHDLFAEQAARTPDAVALVCGGETLSYAELNARANRLAHHLSRMGVHRESRVGICLERGPALVAAILAVLKAGGAYVPLDPRYPAERLAFMLADCAVPVLVTQDSLAGRLRVRAGTGVVRVDADGAAIAAEPSHDPAGGTGGRGLAYVMYTSGSTGTPKGVAVEHRSVVRLVRGAAWARFGPDEVMLAAAPVSFDASTLELWSALLNGGRVVLVPGADPSLAELGRAIVHHGVTTLWLTAGLFQVMVQEQLDDLRGVRQLLAGGDVLPEDAVRRVREHLPDCRLINGYGPTENTTFTCCHTVDDGWRGGPVPIGTPVTNTRAYVLDGALRPVPVGVAGELYAGGAGVARGYVGRPAATAERFVPDPFGAEPGARMYRTGDRVRWKEVRTSESAKVRKWRAEDGSSEAASTLALSHSRTFALDFLGRMDQQVKIRGFRIEPGEVEGALRALPGVREARVLVRGEGADKRLVAYVTGDAETETLRAALRAGLPDHLVPAAFVLLDRLPLTPNGKLDAAALPVPAMEGDAERYVAPRNPLEEVLAGIWMEVLRVDRVGVEDGFFELGGHSLLATRMVSRIRDALGVELPLRALFEGPTVAQLAERVEEMRRAGHPPLPPVVPADRGRPLPLSFSQERLWFLDRMEPGSAFYNVPAALRLRGELDVAALERALGGIVRRHEALRTVFREVEGAPVQVIQPFDGFILPVDVLSGGEDGERVVRERIAAEATRPFDLAAGPLFRARLLRVDADDHVLLLCMHHVVSDGWSMDVLFRELSALYAAGRDGAEAELSPLPVQYADYAAWQREQLRGEALDRQLAYWRERLAGAPALLELPTDRPRPPVQTYHGAVERTHLSAELLPELRALARAEGVTLYMLLLAAFQVLLGKYAGTDDVVVGSPIAGRTRRETEGLIGFFVNTLVMRTDLGGDPSFRQLLRRVREGTLGAYEFQDVPFEKLVAELQPERRLDHAPLFQVMCTVRDGARGSAGLPGLRVEEAAAELRTSNFDLSLLLAVEDGELRGAMEYSTDLFERGTIQRMLRHLERVLEQAVATPDARISALELPDAAERAALVDGWNQTGAEVPSASSIHHLFQAQAARTPDAVALVHGERQLTYRELNEQANRLAAWLRRRGVRPEVRVGICMHRSPELIVSLLAVLKAGGAYVPLDPAHPAERLSYMLQDSGAAVLLSLRSRGPALPEQPGVEVIHVDAAGPRISLERADDPAGGAGPGNLAYVIYTSGSTGRPKGVGVEHRSLVNYAASAARRFGLGEGGRMLQFASISFDTAAEEIFPTLISGAALVLRSDEMLASPQAFWDACRRWSLTVLDLPTSIWHLMVRGLEPADLPESLQLVVIGGERALAEPFRDWRRAAGGRVRLLNTYGPTESTIVATAWEAPDGDEAEVDTVPIGGPVANTRAYVLDGAMRPVPAGVPGELFVGGVQVARGYLGRPSLTAARFLPDPLGREPGARLYRTGDRVRWRHDGTLEYLGRLDDQVKVRGIRIELGEIEALLRRHPAVSDCAVLLRADGGGEGRLVAYVVGDADAESLRPHLRQSLPEHMVPAAFVALDRLPLTPSGKLDRRALPAPAAPSAARQRMPETELEARLARVWGQVLGVESVGVEDSFFDLGGHSLLLIQLQARLAAELGRDFAVIELFQYPTVRALAAHLQAASQGAPAADDGGALDEGDRRGGARQAALARRMQARRG